MATNKPLTRYLTVFPCGHLIQEVVNDAYSGTRPLAICTVTEPSLACCECRRDHYHDCTHPENTRSKPQRNQGSPMAEVVAVTQTMLKGRKIKR